MLQSAKIDRKPAQCPAIVSLACSGTVSAIPLTNVGGMSNALSSVLLLRRPAFLSSVRHLLPSFSAKDSLFGLLCRSRLLRRRAIFGSALLSPPLLCGSNNVRSALSTEAALFTGQAARVAYGRPVCPFNCAQGRQCLVDDYFPVF
jgi:hypothetical protein